MPAIAQLVFRYILLGLTTAFSAINAPLPVSAPVPEYEAPNEVLTFLFDEPVKQPIEIPATPVKEVPKVVPVVKPAPIVTPKPETPKVTPIPTPAPIPAPAPVATTYDAIVNILCVESVGNLTRTTTGSGVIISPTGVILTNAHVAVDLMKGFNCSVRSGSPARKAYAVDLLYIPDDWLDDNKEYITSGIARASTGEHDFALLQMRNVSSLSYIKTDETALSLGDDIETVGYPAERFSLFTSHSNLLRVADSSTVKKVYSFGFTNSDVFSTGKVDNAEQGSSGGAVLVGNKLVGIIANVNSGTINALSIGYIFEYFESDTDTKLSSLLSK